MRHMFYGLDDDHNPIPLDLKDPNLEALMRDVQKRRVALDEIGDYVVSTVFLGLDHCFSLTGSPILFETMIFPKGGFRDLHCERYETWNEAVAGHQRIVADVVAERLPRP